MEEIKTLIIGSGPTDCTVAIYTGRASIQPVLCSGLQPGGQLTTTTVIENFPGFHEGTDANQFISEMHEQAKFYDADLRDGSIVKVDLSSRSFRPKDEHGNQIEAETVIIATGASAKYLGLPDEEKYRGRDMSACATCDGLFYRKRTVAIVGGGDTVCEEAMHLSSLAEKVCVIVHKPQLRAAETMRKRMTERENIEILYNTNTLGLFGGDGVEGVYLIRFKGEENEEKFDINVDGFFLAAGHTPNTSLPRGQLEMDDHGFIITEPKSTATNIEDVFATGDVAGPTYRQGVVTTGTDAMAAIEVDYFLQRQ